VFQIRLVGGEFSCRPAASDPITELAASIDRLCLVIQGLGGIPTRMSGELVQSPAAGEVVVSDLDSAADMWGERKRLRGKRTWEEDVRSIKRMCAGCGFRTLGELFEGMDAFGRWLEAEAARGVKGRTLNKHISKIGVFLRHLKAPRNWARDLERFSIEDSADGSRPIVPAEYQLLVSACGERDSVLRDLVVIARGTGMRPEEVRKISAGMLRTGPDRLELTRRGTKTKRVRIIPIRREVLEAIERLGLPWDEARHGTWPAEKRLRTVAKRAGLERVEEVGWYSLRKLYAYERWRDGLDLSDISRLMGNSPGLVEKHYLWLEAMAIAERVMGPTADGYPHALDEGEVKLTVKRGSCKTPASEFAGQTNDSSDHLTPRPFAASLRTQKTTGGLKGPRSGGRARKSGESKETVYDPRRLRSSAVERRFCKASDLFWVGLASEVLTVLLNRLASLEGLDDADTTGRDDEARRRTQAS
jgi:hypothetical protein